MKIAAFKELAVMGNLGFQEIVLIFVIALIIFGPRKLPEIGKTLGKSLAEFKKATNDLKQSWEEEVRVESEKLKHDVGSLDDSSSDHSS
jgi:TatA/E family protein of Tat protein translocase